MINSTFKANQKLVALIVTCLDPNTTIQTVDEFISNHFKQKWCCVKNSKQDTTLVFPLKLP